MNLTMSKIINLMKNKKYQQVEVEVVKELKKTPQSFDLNKLLAMNFVIQKKYNLAMNYLLRCNEINSDDYDINSNLSLILNKIQDYRSSLIYSKKALYINPNRSEIYHNIAHSYLHISDLEKAELNILKSIELLGGLDSIEIYKYKDTLNLYTDIIFAKGDEERYKNVCKDLLDNAPIHLGDLFRKLLRSDKSLITQNHLKKLNVFMKKSESQLNLVSRNLTKSSVYHCLAEYYQEIDKEISETYYLKSNKLISELERDPLFQRQKFIKNIIKYFDELKMNEVSEIKASDLGDGLIFIIGMPRSGTTLAESIIATSGECVAGGEKVFYGIHSRPIIQQYIAGNAKNDVFQELGSRYLENIDIQRRGKKFFVDKMPENYLYYKFIITSLPNARFINLYRDPWDNAISLFKQYYANDLVYSSSFFGIALEYANYEHLMKKWKSENNHNILDINYEELVSETKNTVGKIWEFCNLPDKYDDSKRKEYFAQTASKQQVRQDIYTSSIKKEEFLGFKEDFYKNLQEQREYWLNT